MVRQRTARGERPKRDRPWYLRTLGALVACCAAYDCDAVDRVILEVGQVSTAGVQATGATITLDVAPKPDSSSPTLRTQIAQLRVPAAGTTYSDIDIGCTDLLVRQPQFACNQGTIAARGGPTGQIAMNAALTYDSANGAVSFSGSGLKLAGATTRLNGRLESGTWALDVEGDGLDIVPARKLAEPWLQLPPNDSLAGHLKFHLQSTGRLHANQQVGPVQTRLTANTSDLNYSNEAGTTVAQNLAAALTGTITRDRGKLISDLQLQSSSGQALAGPVLLDFAKNPLNLQAHIASTDNGLAITQIRLAQKDLVDASGEAQIAVKGPFILQQAHFDVQRLEFAAAYRSFLQLTLATTDFGKLKVGGRASGQLDFTNDAISKVSAYLQNVSMADSTTRLSLANTNGEVHWAAAPGATIQPSQLSWSSSSAYGLMGGPVEMGFTTRGKDFALAPNTRFPIFDGALVVHTLAIRKWGAPDAELDFDAHLEPISMPLLSKAFGWPILSGQLAGRIPGVTYREHVLAAEGDLIANVFDGTITGSRIKLRDPWGPWPRLDADVTARHLDLDLLTHTFSIGSITGRLDADIKGLELFNWSPVAFDARLQTTPEDRSKHLISQRAITSISSVGGGGGSVTAALQSGVLKFFHNFHYDRIGISCQLRDEVCLMNGLEPARTGYYLVKGSGLPRIDIIGNAGRVDWTQLMGQIAASMHSQNIIVR
ncbi:MAG: hypothetical protein JWO04_347 [Gammaproteobacteria bacterium]|nr:hypothetical protein [Gammaproteobacteria bacterium]